MPRPIYQSTGIDYVLSNESQVLDTIYSDFDLLENVFGGLEWELANDVPYSSEQDKRLSMLDALMLQLSESVLPIEQFSAGRLTYGSMIRNMNAIFLDLYQTTQQISPRRSNMLAEGTNSPNFNYMKANPQFRNQTWGGWFLNLPGIS